MLRYHPLFQIGLLIVKCMTWLKNFKHIVTLLIVPIITNRNVGLGFQNSNQLRQKYLQILIDPEEDVQMTTDVITLQKEQEKRGKILQVQHLFDRFAVKDSEVNNE